MAVLLGLGVIGAGTGISSLVLQNKHYNEHQVATDEDLENLEVAMSLMKDSISSLSEVVLQNRRGLDLLFLQQGGLCAALKEECCFYADHTGVIEDSLAKVHKGLEACKRLREMDAGWFWTWFSTSPWLTTLLPSLLGPLLGLIILLSLGPVLFNKLMNFLK